MTDEELVVLAVSGNEQAFAELATRHRDYLVRMITKQSRDYNGAEDIVQKALVKIYRNLPNFDPTKLSYRSWACMITQNVYIDFLRRPKEVTNWEFDGTYESAADTRLAHDDLRDKFWSFVATLSPERRQAVCLIFVEGLSYQQASEVSGVNKSTLKSRVNVTLPSLIEALGEAPENLNFSLERRHEKRVERPSPFYSVPRTAETFTIREFVDTLNEQAFQICDLICYQAVGVNEASDLLGLPEETIDGVMDDVLNQLFRRVFGAERRALAA